MRRLVALGLACALFAGCTWSGSAERAGATGSTSPGSSATGPPATGPEVGDPGSGVEAPAFDAAIPVGGAELSRTIVATWGGLDEAVQAWIADGDPSAWPPPDGVELLALYQQRIVRVLARHERLAERVVARLPHGLAAEVRAEVRAGAALFSHVSPIRGPITLRVRRPEPADVLRAHFEEAEARFDVDWELLAAVMLIETRMGRVVSHSSAGAQGPMQFIPSTWAAYGLGGDVRDPRDAVLGAANYLHASGAPGNEAGALYHYNPVRSYVTAVLQYAKVMRRDPTAYYGYYDWQVFVRTRHGDVRLSGPGLEPS